MAGRQCVHDDGAGNRTHSGARGGRHPASLRTALVQRADQRSAPRPQSGFCSRLGPSPGVRSDGCHPPSRSSAARPRCRPPRVGQRPATASPAASASSGRCAKTPRPFDDLGIQDRDLGRPLDHHARQAECRGRRRSATSPPVARTIGAVAARARGHPGRPGYLALVGRRPRRCRGPASSSMNWARSSSNPRPTQVGGVARHQDLAALRPAAGYPRRSTTAAERQTEGSYGPIRLPAQKAAAALSTEAALDCAFAARPWAPRTGPHRRVRARASVAVQVAVGWHPDRRDSPDLSQASPGRR